MVDLRGDGPELLVRDLLLFLLADGFLILLDDVDALGLQVLADLVLDVVIELHAVERGIDLLLADRLLVLLRHLHQGSQAGGKFLRGEGLGRFLLLFLHFRLFVQCIPPSGADPISRFFPLVFPDLQRPLSVRRFDSLLHWDIFAALPEFPFSFFQIFTILQKSEGSPVPCLVLSSHRVLSSSTEILAGSSSSLAAILARRDAFSLFSLSDAGHSDKFLLVFSLSCTKTPPDTVRLLPLLQPDFWKGLASACAFDGFFL